MAGERSESEAAFTAPWHDSVPLTGVRAMEGRGGVWISSDEYALSPDEEGSLPMPTEPADDTDERNESVKDGSEVCAGEAESGEEPFAALGE